MKQNSSFSSQCFLPSFKIIGHLVLEKKILNGFDISMSSFPEPASGAGADNPLWRHKLFKNMYFANLCKLFQLNDFIIVFPIQMHRSGEIDGLRLLFF